ncbi:hypothetical protein C9374_004768 [Naegleria lovaniensis]|uniref:Uncharacterized protein n=1 Tax=Naegleria lovaniensis TaxID=51637 RepID=A0AA88GKS6_NAELO|nr:uncharacterized protein C9374_004768 [Naegleria lovaniensis]KAG2382801.1 hypothetical protein C9374_004768 [Naegleria lovaniensis]
MLSHHKTFTNAAPPKSNIYSPSSHSSEDGTIFELCGFSFSSIAQAKTFILSRSLGMNPQQEEWQKVFQTVKLLNLHQNSIPKMDGLSDFVNIQELNLSSNNIEKIEGLNCLEQLRVLNLSANRITKVEGLGDLKKLRKLVLSFNKISSLEGLHFLHGPQYNLQYLDVRGNNIENLNELTFIFGLHKIRELYFQNGIDGSFNNPVCKHDRYRPILLSRLALREQPSGSLEIIDGFKISIVKEQSQPSKRQIILNYQHGNTTSDDEEFDGSDTLTSPYVSKYVKYLKNSEQEQLETATVPQALPPQNSNTKTPLRNETVEVAISTHEKTKSRAMAHWGSVVQTTVLRQFHNLLVKKDHS